MNTNNYTYILECSDGSYYTGWTNDLENRIKTHNSGRGSKYTRARLPVQLVYYESYSSKSDALKREIEIKKMRREQKEKLIKSKSRSISCLNKHNKLHK